MLRQQLTDIKKWILRYNTYFDKGFDDVRMNDEKGWVLSNDDTPVFPADDLGNFFYLRSAPKVTYEYGSFWSISDNNQGVGITETIVLVACVRGADADNLAANLITTIGLYQGCNHKLIDTLLHPEDVCTQELAKLKKENIIPVLSRMPDEMAIVSITFQIKTPFVFQKLTCLTNPCKPCL